MFFCKSWLVANNQLNCVDINQIKEKSTIFWDITQCITLKVNRHFGETCPMFLRNVGWLSTDYTALFQDDKTLHILDCYIFSEQSFYSPEIMKRFQLARDNLLKLGATRAPSTRRHRTHNNDARFFTNFPIHPYPEAFVPLFFRVQHKIAANAERPTCKVLSCFISRPSCRKM
jgi:hypothetical protein